MDTERDDHPFSVAPGTHKRMGGTSIVQHYYTVTATQNWHCTLVTLLEEKQQC